MNVSAKYLFRRRKVHRISGPAGAGRVSRRQFLAVPSTPFCQQQGERVGGRNFLAAPSPLAALYLLSPAARPAAAAVTPPTAEAAFARPAL
jgi:hypothetical protein